MMAEVVRRRYSAHGEESGGLPDLVLVDGGIAQAGAARSALDALGLARVPVAGLAKRFEELHLPGRREPVRLPDGSGGLTVLARLRDEAHRFALDYHRRIRERRIRESRLDEIPGIGEKRKARLLSAFGSVRNIGMVGESAVAAVPGIGRAAAREIMAWLRPGDSGPGPTTERKTQ
jgi:excinuclease ABC subunit C